MIRWKEQSGPLPVGGEDGGNEAGQGLTILFPGKRRKDEFPEVRGETGPGRGVACWEQGEGQACPCLPQAV